MTSSFNAKLTSIGIRVSTGEPVSTAVSDIERTLLEAVEVVPGDGRLLSLLLSWVKVHGEFVVVEKLRKFASLREREKPGVTTWLAALAAYAVSKRLHRWKPLIHRLKTPLYLFPKEITESAVQLKGAIPWLKDLQIVLPIGSLRIREEDVLSPQELIPRNIQYKNRYLYGPAWRADIVTAIELGARNPTEISRQIGCSYEPANRIYRQRLLAKGSA